MLADGTYDVFTVDATAHATQPRTFVLELTIVAGEHKGEIVAVHATGLDGEDFDLLGLPGTLTVAGGSPSVVLER